jgi:hypothetical protein
MRERAQVTKSSTLREVTDLEVAIISNRRPRVVLEKPLKLTTSGLPTERLKESIEVDINAEVVEVRVDTMATTINLTNPKREVLDTIAKSTLVVAINHRSIVNKKQRLTTLRRKSRIPMISKTKTVMISFLLSSRLS